MILDNLPQQGSLLWKLPQATHIPGLESLGASRKAHSWTNVDSATTSLPTKLLQASQLGGMSLQPNEWLQLYVTMKQQEGGRIVVVRLSLEDDDDDGDDETSTKVRQSTIFLDYTQYTSAPGSITVDEKGNLYLVVHDGVLLVSSSGSVLGKMPISGESLVDLTIGEDKFLYMSTDTKLFRTRIRNGPLKIPTDLAIKV